jgi:predicted N-acetyltransferase YhbS
MSTASPTFTVRPAMRSDAAALLRLAQAFAGPFPVDPERFDRSLDEILIHHDSLLLVATDGDDVVGYLCASVHPTLYANGPVVWIEELMVDEVERRAGIGRALVQECERWAARSGARLASVATRDATDFWTAVGYEAPATYLRKSL